jgi:hypothetical protein
MAVNEIQPGHDRRIVAAFEEFRRHEAEHPKGIPLGRKYRLRKFSGCF